MSGRHYGVIASCVLMAGSFAVGAMALKVSYEAMRATKSNAKHLIHQEEIGFATRVEANGAIVIYPKEQKALRSKNRDYNVDGWGIEIRNFNEASLEMYVYGKKYRGEDPSHDVMLKLEVRPCRDMRFATVWQGPPKLSTGEGVGVSSMYFADYAHRVWVMNPSKLPVWLRGGTVQDGPKDWKLASKSLTKRLEHRPLPGSANVIPIEARVVSSTHTDCTAPSAG